MQPLGGDAGNQRAPVARCQRVGPPCLQCARVGETDGLTTHSGGMQTPQLQRDCVIGSGFSHSLAGEAERTAGQSQLPCKAGAADSGTAAQHRKFPAGGKGEVAHIQAGAVSHTGIAPVREPGGRNLQGALVRHDMVHRGGSGEYLGAGSVLFETQPQGAGVGAVAECAGVGVGRARFCMNIQRGLPCGGRAGRAAEFGIHHGGSGIDIAEFVARKPFDLSIFGVDGQRSVRISRTAEQLHSCVLRRAVVSQFNEGAVGSRGVVIPAVQRYCAREITLAAQDEARCGEVVGGGIPEQLTAAIQAADIPHGAPVLLRQGEFRSVVNLQRVDVALHI